MIDKMAVAVFNAYYTVKRKALQLRDEECGMETVESVVLMAIALLVASLLVSILTKRSAVFDNDQGLIGYIFERIKEQIDAIFSTGI
ncbi:MAG TPA: hypothetical protein DCG49_13485 [Ruminococcus sp.]|nr:hypothetical protein [Ruminococcus sp.]